MERTQAEENEDLNKIILLQQITQLQGVGTDDPSTIHDKALWDAAWLTYKSLARKSLIKSTTKELEALTTLYKMSLNQQKTEGV